MEDTSGNENTTKDQNENGKKDEKKRASDFPVVVLYMLIGLMILFGTCNSVLNKCLQKLKSKGVAFEMHHFIITMGMFIGELISIFVYGYIFYKKENQPPEEKKADSETGEKKDGKKELPEPPTNFIFAITASCDLCGTTIYTFALTYLTTSIYQMLRGFELFFVALFSRVFLKNPIYRHQYLGIGILFLGLGLCGLNAVLNAENDAANARDPRIGIPLMFVSMLFVGTDYTFQEYFLHRYKVNPFQFVGFEGLFGTCEYTILLFIFQFINCNSWSKNVRDNLCFDKAREGESPNSRLEDTIFAFQQLGANGACLLVFLGYICSIACYNIIGINLTQLVSSTARAIIDTARTVFIWLFFLIWHPVEGTEETFYVLQLIGFILLLAGSVIYNEIVEIPWFNLNYYTRENIAKRKQEDELLLKGGGDPSSDKICPNSTTDIKES